jgi:hypothetical protein
MYIITIEGKINEGAFSLRDERGSQILCIFEEKDDAERYALQLNESKKYPQMQVQEVDDQILLESCDMHNYEYFVITKNDIVVPPIENDYI